MLEFYVRMSDTARRVRHARIVGKTTGKRQGNSMTALSPQASAGTLATVGELFSACARLHAGATALEYGDRCISYGELQDRVRRATAMLAAQGLQRGDRVALLSRNRPEYFEVELAAA